MLITSSYEITTIITCCLFSITRRKQALTMNILFILILLGGTAVGWPGCRRGEELKICPGCPPTCQRESPSICLIPCGLRCTCIDGLIRDEISNRCVSRCPIVFTTETIILTTNHNGNPVNGTIHHPVGIL